MKKDYYTLEEIVQIDIMQRFIDEILKLGKDRVLKFVEHRNNAKQRARFRKFYFQALKKLEDTKGIFK